MYLHGPTRLSQVKVNIWTKDHMDVGCMRVCAVSLLDSIC